MGNEEVDLVTVAKTPNKKTLLERYDIPIEHLSYEYITKSTEVKELERIVLILRSGEEGVYPDLTKHAEERLVALKPESTILRVAEPVITKDMLPLERRKKLESDMNDWLNEMRLREKDLQEGRSIQFEEPVPQPDIRKITFHEQKVKKQSQSQNKSKRIGSCDYSAWDKYDADTEMNRIDLQHEQQKAEIKKTQQKLREKEERVKKASREAIINKITLTGTEFNVMAEEEKKKGNEAFNAGDYEEALQFYDLSIAIDATTQAYNNRAITYIKLRRYSDALNDCNRVISAEHMNIKALLRRGLALEHLEKKSQALADYEAVLKLEPTNKVAISAINKLRAPCTSKKIKMKIEEESSPKEIDTATSKAVEIGQEKSKLAVSFTKANSVTSSKPKTFPGAKSISSEKITHSMQPRVCFCPNAPSSSQHTSPLPHMRDIYCSNVAEKSTKLPKFQSIFTSTNMSTEKSSGVIIEEIPNEPIETPTKVTGKRGTEKIDDKSKRQKGRNTTTTTSGAGDSQNGHGKKSGKLTEECPKKKVNQKEDIMKDYKFDKISTPYEFLKLWHSLKKDSDLVLRAKLLQCLTPENITTFIGNKLDGDMLCTILQCFEKHFCVPEQSKALQHFLQCLTQVKRFSMICMFMDKKDKEVLRKVFLFLETQGFASKDVQDLRKAYGVLM